MGQRDTGRKRFDQAISKALDLTQCIVVLWSKNSVMSDWVMEEALEGKRHDIQTLAEKEWLRLLNDAYKRILKDKTVVFAGRLSLNRAALAELAERLEAKVGRSVTGKTQYLIVGTNPGAKTLEAAQEHHVRIINEELWTEIAQSL